MANDTPMFQQLRALKAEAGDTLLLFRMGDFSELFFEDAVMAAPILEVQLTTRNRDDPDPVPMCGVPWHAVAQYVRKLVEAGHRVAIADQVEDPATAKGIVKRAIVRVVTPGVALDLTDASTHQWLAAVHVGRKGVGVALVDASTGDLRFGVAATQDAAAAWIARHEPCEVIVHGEVTGDLASALLDLPVAPVDPRAWRVDEAEAALAEVVGRMDPSHLGLEPAALPAVGAALAYVRDVCRRPASHVGRLQAIRTDDHLIIDATTRVHLELFRTSRTGQRAGSLLGLLDRTVTAMGARRLRDLLAAPLRDPVAIGVRLDAVTQLVDSPGGRRALRETLAGCADVERLAARACVGTVSPRELGALRDTLARMPTLVALASERVGDLPWVPHDGIADLAVTLSHWLVEDPPATATDGGMIRLGAHADLDRLAALAHDATSQMAALEARLVADSGIASLKVRRNRVFGFYLEVSKANLHRVPASWIRRQTVAGGERFITHELKELEEAVLGADDARVRLEAGLWADVVATVAAAASRLLALGGHLGSLDAFCALAEVADVEQWVRPHVNAGTRLHLVGSRHPVVETGVGRFVPNDVALDAAGERLALVTGPNMAGKSTLLRQVALTAILAQMGSFVPAHSAEIGVIDRIFSRVGASDDLARGRSTFLVEMSETAAILRAAGPSSLVILDEIGRGTSTWDGLSIAWAVAEDLAARVGCRTLFATHYQELARLADEVDGVGNHHVAVAERADSITFLHQLRPGAASRSYGIQCARLAGMPEGVVARARVLLMGLERNAPRDERRQLSLFGSAPPLSAVAEVPVDPVREALLAVSVDDLTPRMALDLVARLATMVRL